VRHRIEDRRASQRDLGIPVDAAALNAALSAFHATRSAGNATRSAFRAALSIFLAMPAPLNFTSVPSLARSLRRFGRRKGRTTALTSSAPSARNDVRARALGSPLARVVQLELADADRRHDAPTVSWERGAAEVRSLRHGSPIAGILSGIKPVVLAVVTQALWGLAPEAFKKSLWLGGLGVVACAASALEVDGLPVLIGGGIVSGAPVVGAVTHGLR
jgi:hypothetical protein